ncbi:MinD/ParA/CobQ/CobA-like protein [Posidoniimonas corsicana]|uniref:MinD/ParA/CobQ/CobA-like protein n=1 Tax=Posidoniimonas corsicana TaxID=1938618 RepID=A0A5C5V1Y5_9BACT|nr:AAA family ATPase [Posidoniimonas corsicana]TWT32421.1 MinD/ParA/CobQ/CobA-like protein [Posidoniimonas corsicana]
MPVIAFINLKGGVAKTTNAVAIAECLASHGKTTLVIDADHQCTATELLLGEPRMEELERRRRTLHDLMLDMLKVDFDPARIDRFVAGEASDINGGLPHLSVIPSSVRINDFFDRYSARLREYASLEEFQAMVTKHRKKLGNWIASNFDYVIIDCPPSLAYQVKFLLRLSDAYVIPSQPNRLSLRGADWLVEKLRKDGFRRRPLGTLWSMCREQDAQHRKVIKAAEHGEFDGYRFPAPFDTVVPLSSKISRALEAPDSQPKSFRGKYGSKFSPVFISIANELLTRTGEAGICTGAEAPDEPLLANA